MESRISTANQMCWIARNLISRENTSMIRIYKTLIRPHLEYRYEILQPSREWKLMIEEVGLLPYSERLQILGLTSLAERRSRGDLIKVYKASQAGVAERAQTWGGPFSNFHLRSSLGGASRHLARTRSQVHFVLTI